MSEEVKLNGARVTRRGSTIFISLPKALWRSAGVCNCPVCEGGEGFWDTLAVGDHYKAGDYAWVVHHPEGR